MFSKMRMRIGCVIARTDGIHSSGATMQISKRHSLVIALVLGEFVCLAFGGIWFCRWLSHSLERRTTGQVLHVNGGGFIP